MTATAATVTLRRATAADGDTIWAWRNDPETRAASRDTAPIALADHRVWLAASLARADRRLYVVVADGVDVGTARLDLAGDEAEVSIHLAPGARGRGLGAAALARLADLAFATLGVGRLVAVVRPGNARSIAAFGRAGFTRDGVDEAGLLRLRRTRDAR